MEKIHKTSHLRMVTIDEDERESLRKLAETKTTTRVEAYTMEKNHKMVHSRLVRIEEDELESLRRLAETSTSTNRGHHQKVKSLMNTNNNNNNNDYIPIRDEAKKVTLMPNKKLETKKSEDINESAEKFIQNFKQQLLLQRLESIENVKEMIARGV